MGKETTKKADLIELLKCAPDSQTVTDSLVITNSKINSPQYEKIACTVSGGADSDVMLHLTQMLDYGGKVNYIFIDTGLEYAATKEHIQNLQEKYGIQISTFKAKCPIPLAVQKYGVPFLSKNVSNMLHRLQMHNFSFEELPYEVLRDRYCHYNEKHGKWIGCDTALKWWCNMNRSKRLNISWNRYLKEFLIENPPQFTISDFCCQKTKKDAMLAAERACGCELIMNGVRKAEGGRRAFAIKSCFTAGDHDGFDVYRPIFWYGDKDKEEFCEHYGVEHSRCYREYGLKRTGCAGCPLGLKFEDELMAIKLHEPRLYQAVNTVFGESYAYTRAYRAFAEAMKKGKGK